MYRIIGQVTSGVNSGSSVYRGVRGGTYFLKNGQRRYLNSYELNNNLRMN